DPCLKSSGSLTTMSARIRSLRGQSDRVLGRPLRPGSTRCEPDTWLLQLAELADLHCKIDGQGRDRTAGLPLFSRIRSVAACCWTRPDGRSTCRNHDSCRQL